MNKRKILTLALTLCMIAILAVGGTLAYFTDESDLTNTFTAGKVGILLDETIVAKNDDDNYVAKTGEGAGRTEDDQEYDLHPGQSILKDPRITVDSDSLDAYVGAIITVKGDLYGLMGVDGYDNIDIHTDGLVSGGLVDELVGQTSMTQYNGLSVFQNDEFAIYQDADKANKTWTMYIFMKQPQAAGTEIVLFEELYIPTTYNNAEMAMLNDMSIEVDAYATQVEGFNDCYKALTTAFDEDWKF